MDIITQQRYIERAIEELLHPEWTTTKQHLEVMELQITNGLPEVARVNIADDVVNVYFKVKEERFFFVVNVTPGQNLEIDGTWVESGHRVYLTAVSEQLNFHELSKYLKLQPLTGWSKGDLKQGRALPYKFSRVSFEPNTNEAYDLRKKLTELLTELEKDEKGILDLVANSDAYISVCKHQYVNGNAGIHFDIDTINRLQKLKLPIDIDTYIRGKEFKD